MSVYFAYLDRYRWQALYSRRRVAAVGRARSCWSATNGHGPVPAAGSAIGDATKCRQSTRTVALFFGSVEEITNRAVRLGNASIQ